MPEVDNTVTLENVKIIFRNFAGKEGPFNAEGVRTFSVLLTDEMAEGLSRDGWNVKATKERELDEGEITGGEPHLPVRIRFKPRPPNVVMISSRGRTNLDETMVEMLDYADIQNVDLIIRPHDWDFGGKSGRKAYVKSLFVTIKEDELERKYADVPFVGTPHAIEHEEV